MEYHWNQVYPGFLFQSVWRYTVDIMLVLDVCVSAFLLSETLIVWCCSATMERLRSYMPILSQRWFVWMNFAVTQSMNSTHVVVAMFQSKIENSIPPASLRYLKSSKASKQSFNLYASLSLFGELYPMCFEYSEMVRFYRSVYQVIYNPQVRHIDPFVHVVDQGGGEGVTSS